MMQHWDIYEIRCDGAALHGVKLRGRVRKFSIEKGIMCFVENAADEENVVRFALIEGTEPEAIATFVQTLIPEAQVQRVLPSIPNPVLSKLKVNDPSRYEI